MPSVETLTNARDYLPNTFTDITIREIDFVTRFAKNWDALREVMGIMRPIRRAPGSQLTSYTASVELQSGAVNPGNVIPYSAATVTQSRFGTLSLLKYAKATTIEDVNNYGAEVAVQKTDDAFLNELQTKVLDDFYTFLQDDTTAMTSTEATFQMAVAMSIGKVVDKFKKMRRDTTNIITFVNTLDAYRYLGAAELTVQSMFGMQYIKNFLGAETMILSSEIPQGKVISVPADNIILYYADPGDSEFAKLGLDYTVAGETNLIGFHANGNYNTAVGESFALMGMSLWAEYADAICIITVDANPLKAPTVAAVAGSVTEPWGNHQASDLQEDIAVANNKITGNVKFIEGGLAPSGPLAGDGYFLFLKWDNIDVGANSILVGLQPSASGMGLVECYEDSDRNGVFKIANNDQNFVIVVGNKDNGKKTKTVYDLDLTFVPANANIGA